MKKLILALLFILVLPAVSSGIADSSDEKFNLYDVFVNYIFGSIPLAGIGVAFVILIIGVITRMSPMSIIYLEFIYLLAFGIGYLGAIVAVPMFLISAFWFSLGIWRFFRQGE